MKKILILTIILAVVCVTLIAGLVSARETERRIEIPDEPERLSGGAMIDLRGQEQDEPIPFDDPELREQSELIDELNQRARRAERAGMLEEAEGLRNEVLRLIEERLARSEVFQTLTSQQERLERADVNIERLEGMLREAEENLEAIRGRIGQALENRERIRAELLESDLAERLNRQYEQILSSLSRQRESEPQGEVPQMAGQIREVIDINLDRIVESFRNMQRHIEELEVENQRLRQENQEFRMQLERRNLRGVE